MAARRRTVLLAAALSLVAGASNPSPLADAASRGLADDVEALLAAGADPGAAGASGITPLEAARGGGFEEIAEILIARGAPAATRSPELVADALLSAIFAGEKPGVAVLVSRGGTTLFAKAYGYADLEREIPAATRTQFRIGSVTKQFTATAVLLLEQDGKLGVGDPLSVHLPDYPRGREITLRHLLTHTSGIPNYTDAPGFAETLTEPATTEELVRSFRSRKLDFEPGERFAYSNSGYVLLGHLVEKVSGRTYADFLETRIFAPLGMRDSGVHPAGVDPQREARGYAFEAGKARDALDWDMSRTAGAGALYSTVLDLEKWSRAIFEGRVLSPETLEQALAGGEHGYGYGWQIGELRGARLAQHEGSLDGFTSALVRFVEPGLTVAVLHNSRPPVAAPGELALRLGGLFLQDVLARRPALRVDRSVSPDSLDAYSGRYRMAPGVVQTISREGNQLYAQLSGQQRYPIFRSAPDRFFFKIADAQCAFLRDSAGRVVSLRHEQAGAAVVAPRIEDPDEIALSPAELRAFTGRYDYGSAILTVTLEGGVLQAQLTGQPKFPIHPVGGDVFAWRVVEARISFVRNEKGTVTHAVHEQNGRSFPVTKLD